MKKRINKDKLKAEVVLGYAGLGAALTVWLGEQEEDPDGVLIDSVEVSDDIWKIIDDHFIPYLNNYVKDHMGPIDPGDIDTDPVDPPPEPEPEPEPETSSSTIRIMNTGAKMSWNSVMYDKFVFPKCGPEFTDQPFEVVYADGNRLPIPNPENMYMTPDNMKYQPGGRWSNNNPDIPTMECYARLGTHPEWCEARFEHPVDVTPSPQPTPELEDNNVFTIQYGDNPNLGRRGHEGRNRKWWTDLHGRAAGEPHDWTQKYELPNWVRDESRRLIVEASDGQHFTFNNTRARSDMLSGDGPKYRAGFDTGDGPKIGMKYGTKTTWIKVRVV